MIGAEHIFTYNNYREFLQDWFNAVKEIDTNFSYRKFSVLAGFKSHTFIPYVLKGLRNLTALSIKHFVDALKMSALEAKYFHQLVMYNQATDDESSEECYREMIRLKSLSSFHNPSELQYKYFEKWYYSVIKEFIEVNVWSGDYSELVRVVKPSISLIEAKEAIKVLTEIDIIEHVDGVYISKHKIIDSASVPVAFKVKARTQTLTNGISLLDELDPNQRFSVNSIFSMSRETYEESIEMFHEFLEKMYDNITKKSEIENKKDVYNMVFQIFPGTISNNTEEEIA